MTASAPVIDPERIVTIKHILCPVDLSEFSRPALAHAVALARWYEADVTALHVFAAWMPPASLATYPGWMLHVPEARESIMKDLQAVVEPFRTDAPALAVQTAEGDAAAEIVQCATAIRADLIVIGTHGRTGFDRFTLGSVTEKVLRKTQCPVLTLPPGAPHLTDAVQYRQILCPTDFSESSERAIAFALSLAVRTGAAVTVLHVVEAVDRESLHARPEDVQDQWRRRCETERHFLHERLSQFHGSTGVEKLIVMGKPHQEIVRVATERQADVIVMGVRGRGSMDLTLFGSTTNQVVRRASCPVITLRS